MYRIPIALAVVAALALCPGQAFAGYEFRFADSSGTEMTSFNLVFPSTLDIRVYLVGTTGDADGNGTDDVTDINTGLKNYGVQLNYSGSATAKVVSTGDITNNASFTGFDGKAIENNGGTTDWARSRDSIASGDVDGSGGRILLATFTFTGLSNGDTLTFSADPTGSNDTRLHDDTLIDSLIEGQSATITVTNVPEPGSMILTGLAAVGMLGGAAYRRFRRKPA